LEAHQQNEEIALEYAKGLVNLSDAQDVEGSDTTIALLRLLVAQYPNNEDIELRYARGLSNLYKKQGADDQQETLERLRLFVEAHSQNKEITPLYMNIAGKSSAS